jgi:hypothetical protein
MPDAVRPAILLEAKVTVLNQGVTLLVTSLSCLYEPAIFSATVSPVGIYGNGSQSFLRWADDAGRRTIRSGALICSAAKQAVRNTCYHNPILEGGTDLSGRLGMREIDRKSQVF